MEVVVRRPHGTATALPRRLVLRRSWSTSSPGRMETPRTAAASLPLVELTVGDAISTLEYLDSRSQEGGGNLPPSPPARLPSSGHVLLQMKGRGNQGVSNVFVVFCLVRGTFSWRWGESNPQRDRFDYFCFGWSTCIRRGQCMFPTLPLGTVGDLSQPSNRVKPASPRHFRVR